MTNELPPTNPMDAFAIEEAKADGALEALNEVRRQYSTIPNSNKRTSREFTRRTEEIEAEIAQLKEELLRSKTFHEQIPSAELGSAIRDIRLGNTGHIPKPVFVIELRLAELAEELDRSRVFN